MLLKRKIKASSIAEIVVALAVIAICFAVASLVFIRSTSTTSKFMDVKKQTELQSEILEKLYRDQLEKMETRKTPFRRKRFIDRFAFSGPGRTPDLVAGKLENK